MLLAAITLNMKVMEIKIKLYLLMIILISSDIFKEYNNQKTQGGWNVQLTVEINFVSNYKDSHETRTIHIKCDNIEIMIGNETNKIIKKLFESHLQRYQEVLEKSKKESEFIFDSVDPLYYKFYRISLNLSGSYIVSPNWLKNKKATVNPKDNDDKH